MTAATDRRDLAQRLLRESDNDLGLVVAALAQRLDDAERRIDELERRKR